MASAVDPDVAGLELQDGLPSGLDYTISNVGAYVEARRENQISAISGDTFSPGGNRIVRFSLGSSTEFLIPESLCFSFDVANTAAVAAENDWQCSHYSPNVLFQRVRVLFGAAVVEDIEHFGRLSAGLSFYHTQERRLADAALGFGVQASETNALHQDAIAIDAGASQHVVCHPFALGLTRVQQLIPLAATAPLQIELYLANADDVSVGSTTGGNTRSRSWQISNVKCHFDTVLLSDSLTSKMLQHLKAGKPLKMLMSSWSCQSQSVPADQASFDIQSQRSFNSVKGVLINGWKAAATNPANWPRTRLFLGPLAATDPGSAVPRGATDIAELQLQLGTWKWPTTPAKGVSELIMMTRKATGSLSGPLVGMYDSRRWHTSDCNIMIDLEKLSRHGENLTGIRSNAGSIMTVQVRNWGGLQDATNNATGVHSRPTEVWICLHVDQIVTFFGDSVDVAV
jgi:hypothetical protein